ncbi:hypothetical protein NUU61_002026 [Penicillium alfredii]|uniref:Nucleotide-diphospho-sugar transferase domain-containing protein n=1 Tax=Penicillium alfredii TaxID=1506179 RepID=A0A9W9FQT2_9EURO|nr:uncharacterized protein NUU61_002026 [Penicillium alfredii]KAJ5104679.1 hypothetical protein NUU61_002026 [Penicillium alfredii]
MDGDTVFPYPHLPIEWMMNLWGIQHNTFIAMAREIDAPRSYDSHGQLVLNTGFIIAQQSPRTEEMFEAWKDCIHDIRYPGCSNYTDRFSHEQYAFGNWVRYDFNSTDEVVTIPCSDAMGFPGRAGEGEECQGDLLGHYTLDKDMAIQAVQRSLMRYLMQDVHREFYREYVQLGGSR